MEDRTEIQLTGEEPANGATQDREKVLPTGARLTQVEVVHAVSHQDVMEESQTWVFNAIIEPVCSVCSVYIFFCKEEVAHEEVFFLFSIKGRFSPIRLL